MIFAEKVCAAVHVCVCSNKPNVRATPAESGMVMVGDPVNAAVVINAT